MIPCNRRVLIERGKPNTAEVHFESSCFDDFSFYITYCLFQLVLFLCIAGGSCLRVQ